MKHLLFAVGALAILSTSAFATPVHVPDSASTVGLLGCAFAGLAGLRVWLKK